MTSWFDDYLEDYIHNDWRVTDDGRYFKYLEQGLIEILEWAGQQGLWTFAFNGQAANRGWPTFAETAKAAYYASVKEELPPRVPRIPIGPPPVPARSKGTPAGPGVDSRAGKAVSSSHGTLVAPLVGGSEERVRDYSYRHAEMLGVMRV